MKYTLFAATIAIFSSNSHALSGKIIDENGEAIAGAHIEVSGSIVSYETDGDGHFNIPEGAINEIHIEAEGFNHKVLQLEKKNSQALTITLLRGVLEVVDVIGIPVYASKIESAQPISVLAGDALREKQASTLGETLKNEVGVHSTYYGGVAGSPVIRGLDGPRVLITQNGLDVSDASRVGPDHVVAIEASTAEQIEILRGPATLFYGSGAIGGVVNIVDDRVPQSSEQKSVFVSEYNSVNDETATSGAFTGGTEGLGFHIDGFWRDSGDYTIPKNSNASEHEEQNGDHEESESRTLANSASEIWGFNIGASVLLDNGYLGLAYGRLDRLNGVPGHVDVHEDEHKDGALDEDEPEQERVLSNLRQDRWQILGEFHLDNTFFYTINTKFAYTDYEHAEIHDESGNDIHEGEGGSEAGTVFKNTTWQARVDLSHLEVSGWKGALSLESKGVDFEAVGEEAFTPPSKTNDFALAIIEEKRVGKLLWQVGARIERTVLSAESVAFEHQHDEGEPQAPLAFDELDFTPLSLSAGIVWNFKPGYNLAGSFAHAERAPNAAELLSAGSHIATRSFEAGALFNIIEANEGVGESGERHLEFGGKATKETSNNIDLTLRKFEGDFGFVINVFHNKIADYYTLTNTGLTTEDLFDDDAVPEDEHGHEEVLPVFLFEQNNATFSGFELEFIWQFHDHFKWTIWGDQVHAELDSGAYIPRISPKRLANQLTFERNRWAAELSVVKYFDQQKVAENETQTDGYAMVDARVSYAFPFGGGDTKIYLSANNLTDEVARVHTSFLKEQAPLPGRNIKAGFHVKF
ncbi:MAG: TonB-dependent receptor [Alteromonadaceae bacterium]|nr:MAG: TonB-dependent receptor [Alteromonadaceae bacterium]